MVDKIYCDHCGAEAHHVYTKEFGGKMLNFCCKGCLGIYEMLHEEDLPNTSGAKPAPKGLEGSPN